MFTYPIYLCRFQLLISQENQNGERHTTDHESDQNDENSPRNPSLVTHGHRVFALQDLLLVTVQLSKSNK